MSPSGFEPADLQMDSNLRTSKSGYFVGFFFIPVVVIMNLEMRELLIEKNIFLEFFKIARRQKYLLNFDTKIHHYKGPFIYFFDDRSPSRHKQSSFI